MVKKLDNPSRAGVAALFSQLLVAAKNGKVALDQSEPYGDIQVNQPL